jgi:hypothetical protein
VNASQRLPRLAPGVKPLEYFEKSIMMTSNIARPSTTNSSAMPRLNHGDALMVPKYRRSTTTRPIAVTKAIAAP